MSKISKKWWNTAEAYKYFAQGFGNLDFSDEAAQNMYNYESQGKPLIKYNELQENGMYNGYAVGKHWMDVTLTMWKEDISDGILLKVELLEDSEIPTKVKEIVEKIEQGPRSKQLIKAALYG